MKRFYNPFNFKAIETKYDGYRFRSRLEARWSVFFNTLGIPYEYEKEGYDLDGLWYLPDFWLPDQDCWVEIKGEFPTKEEREKAELLSLHQSKCVYLIHGIMGSSNDGDCSHSIILEHPLAIPESQLCQQWTVCTYCQIATIRPIETFTYQCSECNKGFLANNSPRLLAAYEAARLARF